MVNVETSKSLLLRIVQTLTWDLWKESFLYCATGYKIILAFKVIRGHERSILDVWMFTPLLVTLSTSKSRLLWIVQTSTYALCKESIIYCVIPYKIGFIFKVIRGNKRSKLDVWMYKHLFGQFRNFQIWASKNITDFNVGFLEREYSILCYRL